MQFKIRSEINQRVVGTDAHYLLRSALGRYSKAPKAVYCAATLLKYYSERMNGNRATFVNDAPSLRAQALHWVTPSNFVHRNLRLVPMENGNHGVRKI
jgi:hypothetical protein